MGMLQTGMTWAPGADMINSNFDGALAHVARHFARWARTLARAVAAHKANPQTAEARTRSGNRYREHGLTPQQLQNRQDRHNARRNYYMTVDLDNSLRASKGKGKGKGKAKPKAWHEMSYGEQWWLEQLYSGDLLYAMNEAEARCHKVQAPRFRVPPEDHQ